MKKIKFSSILVLFFLTMFTGSNVSLAQTSLPEKPLPCNLDEIEPNDSMTTATSVCSNDAGSVYATLPSKDVDYFREDNYHDGSDFTIDFWDTEGARLELLDSSGKQIYGTVTSKYPYGTSYYYHRLPMGTYYFKVYWESEPTSSELFKYLLKIKQEVYRTGWFLLNSNWELWQDGIKFQGTGWVNYKNQWFYLKDGARQQNGWILVGAKWYYLTPNTGVMKTGWLQVDGKWYLLHKINGDMKTGWVLDGGNWYFLGSNGAMKTGWVKVGTKWFYLYSNGKMAYSTKIGNYKLGADGAWIK